MVDLAALARRHEVGKARDVGLRFADPAPEARAANSARVKIGADRFTFAYTDGRYVPRWNGQTYAEGGKPLATDNVVLLGVKNRKDRDTTSSVSVISETVGQGPASVHRDGRVIKGRWRRDSTGGRLSLTADGATIALKPGTTWICLQG